MKRTIIIGVLLISIAVQSWGQAKFYNAKGEKTKIIGEETVLFFPDANKCSIPSPDDATTKSVGAAAVIATLLPSAIDLGFKGIGKLIEKNTKSFAGEFSARTPYLKSGSAFISQFDVYRTILIKGEKQKDTAFIARIVPLEIKGENTFVFAVKELDVRKSGAKIKTNYDYNDYTIEIKVTYYNRKAKEKKEMTSSPISIQLKQVGEKEVYFSGCELSAIKPKPQYLSDKFPINPDFIISEIAVKVTETNPYKIKSEKIKNLYDESSDSLKEMAGKVINLYLPSESQTENKDEDNNGNNGEAVDR